MAIKQAIEQLGGRIDARRESLWATRILVADSDDADLPNIEVGKKYKLWVVQKNGMSTNKSPLVKGEWFTIEEES